jgi:hypothetical protein
MSDAAEAQCGARHQNIIKLPSEPCLDGILEEDRGTVRNVIYVLHSFKMCKSWSALPKDKGYEVVGMVDLSTCPEIELRDMEMLKSVDPLRISTITVKMIAGPPVTFSIAIFVMRKSEPVVLEEQEVVSIRRKRKFWNWGGSF